MAIPVKDETRNVDDNMSAQVQSKAKTIDTTKEFQKLSIDTSIENKQRKQALIDLETYEIFLNKLTTKKDKITNEVKQDDDISNLDQLMELDEKIDKMQETITSRDRKQRAVSAIIQHRGKTLILVVRLTIFSAVMYVLYYMYSKSSASKNAALVLTPLIPASGNLALRRLSTRVNVLWKRAFISGAVVAFGGTFTLLGSIYVNGCSNTFADAVHLTRGLSDQDNLKQCVTAGAVLSAALFAGTVILAYGVGAVWICQEQKGFKQKLRHY